MSSISLADTHVRLIVGYGWLNLEFGHPRCLCNNEVKYSEGQIQLNLLARL
jgi:hypothetical protein